MIFMNFPRHLIFQVLWCQTITLPEFISQTYPSAKVHCVLSQFPFVILTHMSLGPVLGSADPQRVNNTGQLCGHANALEYWNKIKIILKWLNSLNNENWMFRKITWTYRSVRCGETICLIIEKIPENHYSNQNFWIHHSKYK